MKEINVPSGYKIEANRKKPQEFLLTRESDGRRFNLTDRSFVNIDTHFNGLISKTITSLTQSQSTVRILDIGGGIRSQAADEIARRFDKSVRVYNTDILTHNFGNEFNVSPIQADTEHLPFQDNSMDLIYSHQFYFYYFPRALEKEIEALAEVRRVLKPGRTAILDEYNISFQSRKKVKQIQEELRASFLLLKGRWSFWSKLSLLFDTPKFLVMTKNPNSTIGIS